MRRLRNIALESVTEKCDRRTDRQTDGQTDDGQSDPYVSLCFAGNTKTKRVCETRMPPAAKKSQNIAKISKSYILTRPTPGAWGVSEM